MGRRRKRPLNLEAAKALDSMKHEIAQELGYTKTGSEDELEANLERMKHEVASELGLADKIRAVGWPNMTSRECGQIGGRLGGPIGGQMVKRMIKHAEAQLAENTKRR